jgi:hypothetical protein
MSTTILVDWGDRGLQKNEGTPGPGSSILDALLDRSACFFIRTALAPLAIPDDSSGVTTSVPAEVFEHGDRLKIPDFEHFTIVQFSTMAKLLR